MKAFDYLFFEGSWLQRELTLGGVDLSSEEQLKGELQKHFYLKM